MLDIDLLTDKTKGKLKKKLNENDITTLTFELEKDTRGRTPYVIHTYPSGDKYSYYKKPSFQTPKPPTDVNSSFNKGSNARTIRYLLETGGKSKRRNRKSTRKTRSRK